MKTIETRRSILRFLLLTTTGMIFKSPPGLAKSVTLSATPECADRDEPTPSETEGPYFKPQSPLRNTFIEAGDTAIPLRLTGYVYAPNCQPLRAAILDFWHADAQGNYDLKGHRYRGHLFTDENGRFELRTIVPGLYPGRTRHIHLRAQPQHGAILTTQLYFPNEARNVRDSLFKPALVMRTSEGEEGLQANFNFVIAS